MEADKAIALAGAAGLELTDRRRNPADTGWILSFSSGAVLDVSDAGQLVASGRNPEGIRRALGLPEHPRGSHPAKPGRSKKPDAKR